MAHMKPQVQYTDWTMICSDYTCVSDADSIIPTEYVNTRNRTVRLGNGWCGRLSAPGYLDCTNWHGPWDTEREAWQYLLDTFPEAIVWNWDPGHGYHVYCGSETLAEVLQAHVQSINGVLVARDGDFLYTVDDAEEPSDEVEWEEI